MYIGRRIRELRKARGMKLIELAAESGVQIATLSRMEHMKMTGTLEAHMNIARALGVDITQLYTDIVTQQQMANVQRTKPRTDMFVGSDNSSYEILTSNIMVKKMMPILLKIEPDGKTNTEQYIVGTERFVYVLEGKVEVTVGKEVFNLARGNSLYFDASQPHVMANKEKSRARLIVVSTPVAL